MTAELTIKTCPICGGQPCWDVYDGRVVSVECSGCGLRLADTNGATTAALALGINTTATLWLFDLWGHNAKRANREVTIHGL